MNLFPFCHCCCLGFLFVWFGFVFVFPNEYLDEGFSSAGGFSGATVGFSLIHNAVEQLFGLMTSGLLQFWDKNELTVIRLVLCLFLCACISGFNLKVNLILQLTLS